MTKIVAFAGRKQSGKTTCSEFVQHKYNETIYDNLFDSIKDKYIAKIYNFADTLKTDICINILGLTYDQCYGDDFAKNSLTNIEWQNMPGQHDNTGLMTAREVMQFVGTEIFRTIKQDVWAVATIKKIQLEKPRLALIADCRFPNEVEAVKAAGGIVIKLDRNLYHSNHASEVALDDVNFCSSNFDKIIYNNNLTIDQQNIEIYNFLKEKKVLQ